MTNEFETRPLHLHTVESLCSDLISGRPVGVGKQNTDYRLKSTISRSILAWYRTNRGLWAGNVRKEDVEAIVDAIEKEPPELTATAAARSEVKRRLKLVRLEAHRFGGLHAYGTPNNAPENFIFEPSQPITLFEGWNGSGKTSLLNAVIWCLTGQLLRPQRKPEDAEEEFSCRIDRNMSEESEESTYHKLTPVTPLPDPERFLPGASEDRLPIDTWVELTFEDEAGGALPRVRRSQTRNTRGTLVEKAPDLLALGIDPIAVHTGTTMPALIPYIQIGSVSELGQAIAQLTGLSGLVDLSRHAKRAKQRLSKEFKDARNGEIRSFDQAFVAAQQELEKLNGEKPAIAPAIKLPVPSHDAKLEIKLDELKAHYTTCKSAALTNARVVLGEEFDPADQEARNDLEDNIGPARGQLGQLGQLPSASRLGGLGKLKEDELTRATAFLEEIRQEAKVLGELSTSPDLARRKQLYARVSEWMGEHEHKDLKSCAVCGASLEGVLDPHTGRPVSEHIQEMQEGDSELIGHTINTWSRARMGRLSEFLPEVLHSEVKKDLPEQPAELIRRAIAEELFDTAPFQGTLASLKRSTDVLCHSKLSDLPVFCSPKSEELPPAVAEAAFEINSALKRLDRAIAFAQWRKSDKDRIGRASASILGRKLRDDEALDETAPLGAKLAALEEMVKGVAPINAALSLCDRMNKSLEQRRQVEGRIKSYEATILGLDEIIALGGLAQAQVEGLRAQLQDRALHWRSRFYCNAYVTAGHDLIDTQMDSKGTISMLVGSPHAVAPAEHISNGSALRANLFGFFMAFWEYILKYQGGLELLLLDDPQELLDDDNRDRLAKSLSEFADVGAQLFVTTHDRVFARMAVAQGRRQRQIEHRSVHPVNATRAVLGIAPAMEELDRRRGEYEQGTDDATLAQIYASEFRVFVEARLGDLFDDPAYPAFSISTQSPTFVDHLNRLRGLVGSASNDLFRNPLVKRFCDDPALADGAPCLALINKAHHNKESISYREVYGVQDDLKRLRREIEEVHEEFRRWRWREPRLEIKVEVVKLERLPTPRIDVPIFPDIAAFTNSAPVGGTQDIDTERLDGSWFDDKALFYLRNDNLGFSAPSGSVVIVECDAKEGNDQNMVIAIEGSKTYARRLLRTREGGTSVTLAAQTPDSRKNPPSLFRDPWRIQIHRILGVLFEDVPPPRSNDEAVPIERAPCLGRIETAYRVREESALPLALPGQIILGGRSILATRLDEMEGKLVALTLVDGSTIFKKIGTRISGASTTLRKFESIGGLGSSEVVATEAGDGEFRELPVMEAAREILGILYET